MDKEVLKLHQKKYKTKAQSFLGLYISGAKNDKTHLCELLYYPKYNQLVVSNIIDKLGQDASTSADTLLVETLKDFKSSKKVGVNVSTQMPPCFRCRLKCPGIEKCRVEEVVWLRKEFEKVKKKNKNAKMPMPYTDRPLEYYINHQMEKHIDIQYTFSANAAPLSARMFFLKKHFKKEIFEVLPALSVWRIGNYLRVQKSYLKYYKNSDDCEVVRLFFLDQLRDKMNIFMYNQDKQKLVSNPNAFDAFICALSVYFQSKNLAEPKPKAFPRKSDWLCFPQEDLKF